MQNTDLTQHSPDEILLWIDNEPYLTVAWRKTIRTGNLAYVKDAIEEMGLSYRKDQWEAVVDEFEDELEAEEKRMQEEADEANAFFLELSNRSNQNRIMIISELIKTLEDVKQQHGDIHVGFERGEGGFDMVEYLQPCYPKNEKLIEMKDNPAWCIELC